MNEMIVFTLQNSIKWTTHLNLQFTPTKDKLS